jgi:hypothetical protein
MNRFYMSILYLVLISFWHSFSLQAQEFGILEKTGTDKKIYFKSGDEIRYKLKNEDHFRRGHIISVSDSGFQFHYHLILFREIEKVDIRGKRWGNFDWNKTGLFVQIAGIGYIALDTFNSTVVQGETYEFDQSVWVTGGAIFLAGTALRFTKPKKIKLGGRYKFRYLDLPLKY